MMKIFSLLLLLTLFLAVPTSAQEQYDNSGKEMKNYRRTDQQQTPIDPSVRNFFPLIKSTANNEVWAEVHPLIPRVIYFGVYFANADTGWAVGEGGAIIKTTNGGQKWNWIESGVENTLKTVYSVNNGQRVIAAGDGGIILISEDEGATWNTLPSGTTNNIWNMQMITEQIGWMVGEGATALKTTDGGLTWIQQPMPHTTLPYWDVSFADTNYGYIAGNNAVILKTTNGGLDWTIQVAGDNRSLFTVYAFDSLKVTAGGFAGKVVITTDGGNNWTQLPNIQSSVNKIKFIDSLNGFAVTTGSNFQSTDGGYTWIDRPELHNPSSTWNIDFPDLQNGYIVGARMQLMKTTDAGVSWNKTIINDDFLNVYFKDEMNGLINGSEKIYKTTDGGTTLTILETFPYDESNSTRAMTFIDSLTGFVGSGTYSRIYKTTNSGVSWYRTNISGLTDTTGAIRKIFFITPEICWSIRQNEIIKTTDGGDNWWVKQSIPGSISSIFFVDTLNGWATNVGRMPYKTTDGGNNWIEQINSNIHLSRDVYFKSVQLGYIVRSNIFYQTYDGGLSWFQDSSLSGFGFARFTSHDTSNIFLTGNKVYRTTNGGSVWLEFPEIQGIGLTITLLAVNSGYLVGNTGIVIKYFDDSVPVELINFHGRIEGNKIFLEWTTATETNNLGFWIQRKTPESDDWFNIGFVEGKGTSTEPNHYSFIDELLHEGIYYYRLKQADYDGSTNYSEEISIEYEYPGKFKVYPNYPNPFNPVTNLKVLLPNKSYLTIKLFNITGELVDIIFEGTTEGGIFNAQVSSKGLSSGVYFCKVTANELSGRKYNESIKILVLK